MKYIILLKLIFIVVEITNESSPLTHRWLHTMEMNAGYWYGDNLYSMFVSLLLLAAAHHKGHWDWVWLNQSPFITYLSFQIHISSPQYVESFVLWLISPWIRLHDFSLIGSNFLCSVKWIHLLQYRCLIGGINTATDPTNRPRTKSDRPPLYNQLIKSALKLSLNSTMQKKVTCFRRLIYEKREVRRVQVWDRYTDRVGESWEGYIWLPGGFVTRHSKCNAWATLSLCTLWKPFVPWDHLPYFSPAVLISDRKSRDNLILVVSNQLSGFLLLPPKHATSFFCIQYD